MIDIMKHNSPTWRDRRAARRMLDRLMVVTIDQGASKTDDDLIVEAWLWRQMGEERTARAIDAFITEGRR